jgi:enoyl-[acyl-carrier protein] reductase II
MLAQYLQLEQTNAPVAELHALADGSFAKAVEDGDMEHGTPMAGEVAGMMTTIRPVKEIITTLFGQAREVAAQLKIE